jgi:UDP-N-acetylglucosamine 1-carboxyvinyltransferase
MGMNYEVKDNLLVINGGNKLQETEVTALDLRAGAALMIAGLVASPILFISFYIT